jgi:hypothetical protein
MHAVVFFGDLIDVDAGGRMISSALGVLAPLQALRERDNLG